MRALHPLCSSCLYRFSSRLKALDAASVEGEPNDKVCEKADASASFKSKMERGENVTPNLLDFLEFCHTIKKKQTNGFKNLE